MGLKKFVECAQNSRKLCAEFASYACRIVSFVVQNSDNPRFN